jgi:hypothetical protein
MTLPRRSFLSQSAASAVMMATAGGPTLALAADEPKAPHKRGNRIVVSTYSFWQFRNTRYREPGGATTLNFHAAQPRSRMNSGHCCASSACRRLTFSSATRWGASTRAALHSAFRRAPGTRDRSATSTRGQDKATIASAVVGEIPGPSTGLEILVPGRQGIRAKRALNPACRSAISLGTTHHGLLPSSAALCPVPCRCLAAAAAWGVNQRLDRGRHPGLPSFNFLAGGTGTPAVQGVNEIYFNLYLPSGPRPAGGWPVAINGQGSAGNKLALLAQRPCLAAPVSRQGSL